MTDATYTTPARPLPEYVRLKGSLRLVYDRLPLYDALTVREIRDILSARGWKLADSTVRNALDALTALGWAVEDSTQEDGKRAVKCWRKVRAG